MFFPLYKTYMYVCVCFCVCLKTIYLSVCLKKRNKKEQMSNRLKPLLYTWIYFVEIFYWKTWNQTLLCISRSQLPWCFSPSKNSMIEYEWCPADKRHSGFNLIANATTIMHVDVDTCKTSAYFEYRHKNKNQFRDIQIICRYKERYNLYKQTSTEKCIHTHTHTQDHMQTHTYIYTYILTCRYIHTYINAREFTGNGFKSTDALDKCFIIGANWKRFLI